MYSSRHIHDTEQRLGTNNLNEMLRTNVVKAGNEILTCVRWRHGRIKDRRSTAAETTAQHHGQEMETGVGRRPDGDRRDEAATHDGHESHDS
jgi:hypothetical protein